MCELARLFLPFDTLEKLVCSECKEFLRYGPIKVKLDGESVCGRCSGNVKHTAPLIQHKAFEEIIRLVCFPCKNTKLGCPEYIMFDDIAQHERFCAFRSLYCPADFLCCNWSGTSSQLPQHYGVAHNQLLMSEAKFELKLKVSGEENRVYVQDGVVFVVKIKVSKEDGKSWMKIEHMCGLDYEKITYKPILHTLEENGLQMMLKEKEIKPFSSATIFDVKDSQCVDITSLLTILENPNGIFCTININIPSEILQDIEIKLNDLKCPHCGILMTPPIFICPEGHSTCIDCTGYKSKCKSCNKENINFNRHTALEVTAATNQIPCRWSACEASCNYSDVRKHESTCVHKKYKCPRCYKWHGTHKKIQEHFAKEHDTHPMHLSHQVVINGMTTVYDFYVLAYGEIFGCSVFPTDENGKNISVWYYGTPSLYDKFEYYVELRCEGKAGSEEVRSYQLRRCCATENCYSFNLKIPNKEIEAYADSEYDLVFRIVQIP